MEHLPVMLAEALQQLAIKKDGVYLDCTFGRGGHSAAILNSLGENGRLLAFDRDWDAINSDYAQTLLKDTRFKLIHSCFSNLENALLHENLLGKIDGILIDLGVSSPQLDNPERGFSFLRDGRLDMRMDEQAGVSAEQWLATVDEKHLVKVLFDYGEEKFARRIAKAIVDTRAQTPISTTRQLAALCEQAVPKREKKSIPQRALFKPFALKLIKN